MIDLAQLKEYREGSARMLQPWKSRSMTNDLIARGEWTTLWDDASVEVSSPLVENIYLEALEDKAMTAGTLTPSIMVPPTPGTRIDNAEKSAEKRRHVHVSYMNRSNFEDVHMLWYLDFFHHGAAYSLGWFDKFAKDGTELPPAEVFPYYLRLDPRQGFPLSHDNKGELTSILFRKVRQWQSVVLEYGENHPTIRQLKSFRSAQQRQVDSAIEEIWYFDTNQWAVAFADASVPYAHVGRTGYRVPLENPGTADVQAFWAFEPEKHHLQRCPVSEGKRTTFDGEYRGGLDAVIPQLRVAHAMMARILDDTADQVYAPVLIDNVANWEEYGPGAVLRGDGQGPSKIEFARPPTNFDGRSVVAEKKTEARNQARHPEQRLGQPGFSIGSAKAVEALQGSFNAELAASQVSTLRLLRLTHAVVANMDEVYGDDYKSFLELEKGQNIVVRYRPSTLFKGDYRVHVSYGGNFGLDQNARILNAATIRNMGSMSSRTFMDNVGLIDNPLEEEREIGLERMSDMMAQLIIQAGAANGDISAVQRYIQLVDSERETHRSAILKVVAEMSSQQPPTNPQAPEPGDAGAAVLAARSRSAGGIPGNAEGQPIGDIASALGPGVARALSENAPGGTAA